MAQSRVQAWGWNSYGALGDGTMTTRNQFVTVKDSLGFAFLENVISVAHGGNHGLAVKSDGTVWAWGDNYGGELGQGNNVGHLMPVQVRSKNGLGMLTGVVSVACAGASSLALKADGTLVSWGYNGYGQLGNNNIASQNLPVDVVSENGTGQLSKVVAISGGGAFYLALKQNGTLVAWGSNLYGELGNGTLGTVQNSGIPSSVLLSDGITPLHEVVSFSCGDAHALALTADGSVYSWGNNTNGQLGIGMAGPQPPDDKPSDQGLPVRVLNSTENSFLANIVGLAGGGQHSLALATDGSVYSWGNNTNGQLGDGTLTSRSLPALVLNSAGTTPLNGVKSLVAGRSHSLAVKTDRTVISWGYNVRGQLGDGTFTDRSLPVPVPGLTNTDLLASTYDSTLAISLPQATVSGNIALGIVPDAPAQFVTFEFRSLTGGLPVRRVTPISASGDYTLTNLPPDLFRVWIKGSKWLAVTTPADTRGGKATGVSVTPPSGDVDGNNIVDVDDLTQLLFAFNTVRGDGSGLYEAYPNDDLDGNGKIDVDDLTLLLFNFNISGEN